MNKIQIKYGWGWWNGEIRRHYKYTNSHGTVIDSRDPIYRHALWKWKCTDHICKSAMGGARTFQECVNNANKHYFYWHTDTGKRIRAKL